MSAENSGAQTLDDTLCFQMEMDHHSEMATENFEKVRSKVDLLLEEVRRAGGVTDCDEEVLDAFRAYKQIPESSKKAYEEMKNLVRQRKDHLDEINTYKQKIGAIEEQYQIKKADKHASKNDYKHLLKIFKHATSKYTAAFNFDVDVEDVHEDEYTAVIKFKGKCKRPVRFVVDRKRKSIKCIDATSIGKCVEMCPEDGEEQNLKGALHKLRELVLNAK